MHVALVELIEIVVVNSGDGKRLVWVFNWRFWLFNVLKNEFSELGDQSLEIFHDFVLIVCADLFDHVLLGRCITSEEIWDSTKKNGISKLNVIPYVFFEQLSHKLAKLTYFQFILNVD